MPRVSICVPTFNGELHLGQCLDSALAQTFSDFELLVVDDHSTDGTLTIAGQYAAQDPRVRIETGSANIGMVNNWNRAVELARGDWIKFLFQDDTLAPDCVSALLARADAHKTQFAACFRNFLIEPGTPESSLGLYKSNVRQISALYKDAFLPPEAVARFATRNVGINFVGEPTVTLIHQEIFHKVGTFDPAIVQRVDTEFWVRAGLASGIAMERKVLASFRVHERSASATNYATRQFADNYLDTLAMFYRYLYDPAYELLRTVAKQDGLFGQIEDLFEKIYRNAKEIANKADGEHGELLRGDWRRLLSLYPDIAAAVNGVE
jgi:glycosyltransferase involved in cell wall biosynthesis